MEEYRKTDYLLSGLAKHKSGEAVNTGETSDDEEVVILSTELWKLDDGMEIEICMWLYVAGMDYILELCDISADKKEFERTGNTGFPEYLGSLGLPLENVEDCIGRWHYCGLQSTEKNPFHRVQFSRVYREW